MSTVWILQGIDFEVVLRLRDYSSRKVEQWRFRDTAQ